MREYIYKVIIFVIAIIIVFEFTIGKEISQINEKINTFGSQEGRKKIITSIKKEKRVKTITKKWQKQKQHLQQKQWKYDHKEKKEEEIEIVE